MQPRTLNRRTYPVFSPRQCCATTPDSSTAFRQRGSVSRILWEQSVGKWSIASNEQVVSSHLQSFAAPITHLDEILHLPMGPMAEADVWRRLQVVGQTHFEPSWLWDPYGGYFDISQCAGTCAAPSRAGHIDSVSLSKQISSSRMRANPSWYEEMVLRLHLQAMIWTVNTCLLALQDPLLHLDGLSFME